MSALGIQPFAPMKLQPSGRALQPCRVRLPCSVPHKLLRGTGISLVRASATPVAAVADLTLGAPVHALSFAHETLSLGADQGLSLTQAMALYDVSEGLETPIQLLYLLTLLAFLAAGAFLVVRQVLIRRELDEAAKQLGERIRTGEATCEDYFELGVILTRKRLYTQATKNLEKAKKVWDGEESELAQVHNALGYCYLNMEKVDESVVEFRRSVELQPGYVTAWNNLGDAYEKTKSWRNALSAYEEALTYAPNNSIARQRSEFCKTRCERLGLN